MNTKNNQRHRDTIAGIDAAFVVKGYLHRIGTNPVPENVRIVPTIITGNILARFLVVLVLHVAPFVDWRCKTPLPEIQAAVDGAVSPEQAVKLRQCLDHIDQLQLHRQRLEQEILRICEPFADVLQLLRTVPSLNSAPMMAISVLSEIGGDMSVFPTAKHLCSWAGCCPRNDQSGGKIKSTRISRAGTFLKPLLVQVANALILSKKHPEFSERYRRIKAAVVIKKPLSLCAR